MKHRRVVPRVILGVLIFLIIGGMVLAIWQWQNLKVLLYSRQYSPQERQAQMMAQQQTLQKKLEQEMQISLNPLTKADEKLLREGSIKEEDALRIIKGETTSDAILAGEAQAVAQPVEAVSQGESPQAEQPPNRNNEKLEDLLARVYLLRGEFNGKIDGLIAKGKAEYAASKGKKSKLSIAQQYLAEGNALEAECDAQMEELISQITEELEQSGEYSSLPSEIQNVYQTEKEVKKAELIEKYS